MSCRWSTCFGWVSLLWKVLALSFVVLPTKTVVSLSIANGEQQQHGGSSHFSPHDGSTTKLFPYQQEGVVRLLSRKRLLLADQMGLGKTIQCIEAINRIGNEETSIVLIVCPKSVMGVWKRELEVWLDPKLKSAWGEIQVASTKSMPELRPGSIALINYDICHKLKSTIQKPHYHVLICDEAHYLKTPDTKRTKAILGGGRAKGIQSDFLWLLTGTPVLNRPIELYPLLHSIAPEEFPSMQDFAGRYCDPKEKIIYKGSLPVVIKDYSGSSNLKELSHRLEPIMLRRYKMDVLSQLPEKFRSCTCLTPDAGIDVAQQERDRLYVALQELKEENTKNDKGTALDLDDFGSNAENLVSYINKYPNNQVLLAKISTVRQETAFLKLKPAIELLEEYIMQEKVVVFAYHRAVIDQLTQHFGDRAVGIKGGMKREDRDEAVRLFQDDPYVRLFVGSIRAAGVGLTLTAASHVIFLELDWSPGIMTQAEDRCHRVGQSNNVRIQYLVFRDTIDEWLSKSMLFKQSNIDEILPEKLQAGGTTTGYVFDFGKHEGVRLEDVPRPYVQFLLKKEVWRSRPDLWRALASMGLVFETPPIPTISTNPHAPSSIESKIPTLKEVNFVFDFGKHSGKRWADVPSSYRDWLLKEKVWKSKGRQNLLAALVEAGLKAD